GTRDAGRRTRDGRVDRGPPTRRTSTVGMVIAGRAPSLEAVMHLALGAVEGEAEERSRLGQGDEGEDGQVQGGQGRGEALVVAGQAAPPRLPGERALDYPPLGQEDEAALGLR